MLFYLFGDKSNPKLIEVTTGLGFFSLTGLIFSLICTLKLGKNKKYPVTKNTMGEELHNFICTLEGIHNEVNPKDKIIYNVSDDKAISLNKWNKREYAKSTSKCIKIFHQIISLSPGSIAVIIKILGRRKIII